MTKQFTGSAVIAAGNEFRLTRNEHPRHRGGMYLLETWADGYRREQTPDLGTALTAINRFRARRNPFPL